MSFLTFNLLAIIFLLFTYFLRKRFLTFVYASIYFFTWFAFPILAEILDYKNPYQVGAMDVSIIFVPAVLFGFSFLLSSMLVPREKRAISYFDVNINEVLRISICCIIIGLIMKYFSGSLFHSSVLKPSFTIPALYGLSDKIYYVGVGFLLLLILHPERKLVANVVFILIMIFFALSGSRVSILIPIIFIILFRASTSDNKTFIRMIIVGILSVFSIVFLIGYYRIEAQHQDFSLRGIWNLVSFRIYDFQWPLMLINDISLGVISKYPELFWYNFSSILPGFSKLLLGESIFRYDTLLMLKYGYANKTMSVPMTPVGEAILTFGSIGLIVSGVVSGLCISMLDLVIRRYRYFGVVIAFILFRPVAMLNTGTMADVIALVTKDLIIAVLIFNFALRIRKIKGWRRAY